VSYRRQAHIHAAAADTADSGLLIDGMVDLAKGIADHFCFEISKFHLMR
jgi:hypothetical protein